MKTEKQRERDKKGGVINLEHSFDKKTGMILSKGLIRKEVDPEKVIESMAPVKQKLNALAENIIVMKKRLESAPVSCKADVLEFLDLQKRASEWLQAESGREQLKQRQEEYDTLTDDIVEQEELLQEYHKWKEKK